ncbi:MAG TPA: DoxX family membrane protein [Patescibacteria group bacterium]
MAIALLLGRILFGGYFLYSGYNHLTLTKNYAGYAKSKNVPFPTIGVVLSGLMLLLGGLGVLFWVYVRWALILVDIFLAVVSFMIHNFWSDTDQATKAVNQVNFGKNMALIGASLIIMSLA